jgi:hypothetical protein
VKSAQHAIWRLLGRWTGISFRVCGRVRAGVGSVAEQPGELGLEPQYAMHG